LRSLESGKRDKQGALDNYRAVLESISHITPQLRLLQVGFQQIRSDLSERRRVFLQARVKLTAMHSEMEMFEFARNRQQLADCLNEALESLVEGVDVKRHEVAISHLRRAILEIGPRTLQLMNSLG
jgi:hypothetical protein